MYYHGEFLSQQGETIAVHIITENDRTKEVEIGDENSGVMFTTNPVEIEHSVNDTFDHLLRSQASINLLVRDFMPDFFCKTCMDAVVNVYKGDKCVFAGYIEPQMYSQSYNEVYDELQLSCIDALSALQYSKYRGVGGYGVDYGDVKINSGQARFSDIIRRILSDVTAHLDIVGGHEVGCYFDESKALTAASHDSIFDQLAISELLFLGDEESDVWQSDEVLEEVMKYLNLHIVQNGLDFYMFSWETLKEGKATSWYNLANGSHCITERGTVEMNIGNAMDTDTTISIGEVYNQILLTCKTEDIDNVIVSPLDDDSLTPVYPSRAKYMTEYSLDDMNASNAGKFWDMFYHPDINSTAGGVMTDWYLRLKNNPNWVFPDAESGENLIDKYCGEGQSQSALPIEMAKMPAAALMAFGKAEYKLDGKDNSPVSKVDMSDYLAISVNGNGSNDLDKTYPNEESLLKNAPCAVYTGAASGSVYSPADDESTNYIVFSGKLGLNPRMLMTTSVLEMMLTYSDRNDFIRNVTLPGYVGQPFRLVPVRGTDKHRFYIQKYYTQGDANSATSWLGGQGLSPYTGTYAQSYKFTYSAIGDSNDHISKVAVLACMLIIGDKCLVEMGTNGQPSDFEWRTYKPREKCNSDDEYYQQCFYIGFDPKIDDYLISTEFSIQNNVTHDMGLDTTGMAIPIRRSDKLNGEVKFMILGPVNTMWDVVTRRHRTWFRREKWSSNSIPLLSHVSSIFIKDFNVKIHTDNSTDETDDNDIIYMSDTRETFINRKDDIEFRINSALTHDECVKLGVRDAVRLSTPLDLTSGVGVLSIYDKRKGETGKPEQIYVDSYYEECHKPRVTMTHKILDTPETVSQFYRYRHPAMVNKTFYVQGISRNLIEGYAELTLKEVWND